MKKIIMKIIPLLTITLISYIAPSFSAPEVYIISGTGNKRVFKTRGGFAPGEIKQINYPAFPGISVIYQAEIGTTGNNLAFMTKNDNFVCSKDINQGTAEINAFLAASTLTYATQAISGIGQYSLQVMCRTNPKGENQYDDVYYYNSWIGSPVNPDSPYCTVSIPSTIDFGEVQIGETRKTSATGKIQCDKDADVKMTLSSGGNNSGDLTMDGAKIKYALGNNATTERLKITGNTPVDLKVNIDLLTTGNTSGTKNGFILLRSEVQ